MAVLTCVPLFAQAQTYNLQNYDFQRRTPGGTLTASTPATVTFTSAIGGCPRGVAGTDDNHYLYISGGTGTAETVLITGGTCTGGAPSGTITFTPANNHSGAWTITSATDGQQEAINDGCIASQFELSGAIARTTSAASYVPCTGQNVERNWNYASQKWANLTAQAITFNDLGFLSTKMNALDGGVNQLGAGYSNKTNWNSTTDEINKYTYGQNVQHQLFGNCPGVGDCVGLLNVEQTAGVSGAAGDEGAGGTDDYLNQYREQYEGTVSSGGSSGSQSLTISPTYGSGTQGAGRVLIDTARDIETGDVTAITRDSGFSSGHSPTKLAVTGSITCCTGTNTQLGTAVTAPGEHEVTPGSMSGISVGALIGIFDAYGWEFVKPSATTGTTFTATFIKAHGATAIVTSGGLTGYFLEMDADRCWDPPGFFSGWCSSSGTHVVRWLFPVIANISGYIYIWTAGKGYWSSYTGRWSSGGTDSFHAYRGAEVTSVASGGQLSNTLTLAPNFAQWTSSDTVELAHSPLIEMQGGYSLLQKFLPAMSPTPSSGRQYAFWGWNGEDTGINLQNYTPADDYADAFLTPTAAVNIGGRWRNGIRMQYAPDADLSDGAALYMECPEAGCSNTSSVIIAGDSGSPDWLHYKSNLWSWQGKMSVYKATGGQQLSISGNAAGTNDAYMDLQAVNGAPAVTYGRIGIDATNGTAGTETGDLWFSTVYGGTLTRRAKLRGDGYFDALTGLCIASDCKSAWPSDLWNAGASSSINYTAGKVSVGSATVYSAFSVVAAGLYSNSETSANPFQVSSGFTTTTDYTLYGGADATNGVGYLQAVQWGVGVAPIALSARGGGVAVGKVTLTYGATLDVNGVVQATGYQVGGVGGTSCAAGVLNPATAVVTNGLITTC